MTELRTDVEKLFGLGLALVEGMDRALAGHGLSRARAQVLWTLAASGPVAQRRLAELLMCSPRNVTALLDALERDGLIARARHPQDRRVALVELTDAGAETADRLQTGSAAFAVGALADLPPDDLAAFRRVVDTLLTRLLPHR